MELEEGGGRGGSDEGACFRPGGGGKDLMNGEFAKRESGRWIVWFAVCD